MASTSTSGSKGWDQVTGVFDELAPSASTSALKPMKRPSYDVFINHRGEDVKSTVATALYTMLSGDLSVFLDKPELEYGYFFPQTIEAAMRSALVHIAIFSERYAESPWCLSELSFMLKSGAPIIPIFYHVDPSDLRWVHQGKGKYVDAFNEYVRKGRYLGKLNEWKKALYKISFCTGEVIKNKDDEDMQLNGIVNTVLKIIKRVSLKVADHPVGMEEIVKDFELNTIQSVEGDLGVQIIGIWGMGGSGKTTLAKELYNKKSPLFKWSSFVSNVRDASTKGFLYERQKKIMKDLCVQDVGFYDIEEGKETLSRNLRSVRVLIILDDVDHVDQLDALLPVKDRLESGSLIIVTTRERDVLNSWRITSIYKMKALDLFHARQLFCWHAFEQPFPWDGFEELVEKFLETCHRLPLALKVIGGELKRESNKECWEFLLHKIMTTLHKDIQQILKISYDTLDDQEKEMFLDVACFFIGEETSKVIELWKGLQWSARQGWKRLLNKCLVEIDDYNSISMHDHIRDLGRDIAKKQSPYRIWHPQPIINVQNQREGRIGIQGIMAISHQIKWMNHDYEEQHKPLVLKILDEVEFKVSCSHGELMVETNCGIWPLSPSLVGLKFLVISGDSFNQIMGEVSRQLVWLRWFQTGQRNLPPGLSLKRLRILELYEQEWSTEHHLEELWGETEGEAPVQLRELLIFYCYKIQRFPKSIGHLSHLKKIVATSCPYVTSLPDEFCLLQSLEHLVLPKSKMLSLPSNFGNLRSLQHLDLSHSSELRGLPVSFENLMSLEHLNLRWCSQLSFKSEEDLNCLQNITKLEYFNLDLCKQLEELPHHIANNVSLRELYFHGTSLRKLPDNIGQLSRLRKMKIENLLLTSLPTSFGDLSSLTNLEISGCLELESLPDSLGRLSSLTNLQIRNCPKLQCLPDSLGCLSSLINLVIYHCLDLKRLLKSPGDLSSLTNLEIRDCPKLECLPDSLGLLSSLTNLKICQCLDLKLVPESLGDLSSLTNLEIRDCPKLEHVGVKCLPKAIRQLSNLQRLNISNCPISDSSLSFGSSNLKYIEVRQTEVCRISCSEGCCPQLERLDVFENHHLEEIEGLPRTLEIIYLENCEMLKKIPSFARLTSLRIFRLRGWNRVEKIEGIENCIGLEELSVETRWEVPGIESLEHLQNLKVLELRANNGSVIERCIQRIQKLPNETRLCTRAVPEAASLVDSLFSPDLFVVDSISNRRIMLSIKLAQNRFPSGDALMLCFVINCASPQMTMRVADFGGGFIGVSGENKVEKGRWAWVGVFTPPLAEVSVEQYYAEKYFDLAGEYFLNFAANCPFCEEDVVEKGLVVRGKKQTIMEALRSLVPLLRSQ